MEKKVRLNSKKTIIFLVIVCIVLTTYSIQKHVSSRENFIYAVEIFYMNLNDANNNLKEALNSTNEKSFEKNMRLASISIGRTQVSLNMLKLQMINYRYWFNSKLFYTILFPNLYYMIDLEKKYELKNPEDVKRLTNIQADIQWLFNEGILSNF